MNEDLQLLPLLLIAGTVTSRNETGAHEALYDEGQTQGRFLHGTQTFTEIGAYNGIDFSNTLVLERCFGWRGVLIEGSTYNFHNLVRSGRKGPFVQSAICAGDGTDGKTVQMTIGGQAVAGQLDTMSPAYLRRNRAGDDLMTEAVKCQSMTSILSKYVRKPVQAHGPSRIGFLSLDVEGAEATVLSTIDPQLFRFEFVMVETEGGDKQKVKEVRDRLASDGLQRVAIRVPGSDVFARPRVIRAWESMRLPPQMRLTGARIGHCGTTSDDRGKYDLRTIHSKCSSDTSGSWKLGHGGLNATGCIERCRIGCERCRYVSISLKWKDCSWYADCNMNKLQTDGVADFQTIMV